MGKSQLCFTFNVIEVIRDNAISEHIILKTKTNVKLHFCL